MKFSKFKIALTFRKTPDFVTKSGVLWDEVPKKIHTLKSDFFKLEAKMLLPRIKLDWMPVHYCLLLQKSKGILVISEE